MGKVLAPHNARPKTVPLIKCAKVLWFSKYLIFPKISNKRMYKKTKLFFLTFWARRGLILTPTYFHVNGESGLRSSC